MSKTKKTAPEPPTENTENTEVELEAPEKTPVEAEESESTKDPTDSTNAPETQSCDVEISPTAPKIAPCPKCGNESPKPVGEPEETVYKGIELIVRQHAVCKECGEVFCSRVVTPITK